MTPTLETDVAQIIPFPKHKRIVDKRAGLAKVRAEGRCRGCGRWPSGHYVDALNRAHLIGRGVGGDDVDDNMIPLCGSGSSGCHGLMHSHARGWRDVAARIRASLTEPELAYVLRVKGEAWLDSTYPRA